MTSFFWLVGRCHEDVAPSHVQKCTIRLDLVHFSSSIGHCFVPVERVLDKEQK